VWHDHDLLEIHPHDPVQLAPCVERIANALAGPHVGTDVDEDRRLDFLRKMIGLSRGGIE
jgi:hypothetical protein